MKSLGFLLLALSLSFFGVVVRGCGDSDAVERDFSDGVAAAAGQRRSKREAAVTLKDRKGCRPGDEQPPTRFVPSYNQSSNLVRVAPDCNRSYCEDSFSGYSGSV